MNDLKRCFEALKAKAGEHTKRWRYYDGQHHIAFVNPKINEVIPNGVVFKKNWCQVVIDTARNRLGIEAWNHENDKTAEMMTDLWRRTLARVEDRLELAALTTGESYLLIWPKEDDSGIGAYYHDPRQVHVLYRDDMPDVPRVACKLWDVETDKGKRKRINLYYQDRIEHYVSNSENPDSPNAFTMEGEAETNPYGVIPVFHFRLDERRLVGELSDGVLSLQDAMNKLINDMMVASEYSSFPQRWGIGHWDDSSKTPVGAATMLKVPPAMQGDQASQVGAFPTTPPSNYLEPINALSSDMAVLSATPKHYFAGSGGNLSGEALQAMEAPLVSKIERYQGVLGPEWVRAMKFCLSIQKIEVPEEDIEAVWSSPHTVQPESQAKTRLTNTQAGIPITNILRDEGWTEEQLDQLKQDQAEAAQAQPSSPAPSQPGTGQPVTREEAAPRFDGVTRTPDAASFLAGTGAIGRAVNRAGRAASNGGTN